MKALKHTAFVALALVAVSASAQKPQTQSVEATGEAAIIDNDKQKAMENAKQAAFRNAVEQVAGVLVSADTLVENNTLVSDRVFSKSSGYIKSFKPVGEPKIEEGVLSIKIKAEVATAELDKDLQAVQALIGRLQNRRLVIVINETTVTPKSESVASGVMTTVLTEGFKKDGWTILDPNFVAGQLNLTAATTSLDSTEVKKIGELSKADYVLYGRVGYRQQVPDGAFGLKDTFPVTGEYELAVFATDNGDQLTTLAGKLHPDKGQVGLLSYERSAQELTKKRGPEVLAGVRKAVVEYLSNAEQNGNRLVTTVIGVGDYKSASNFRKVLLAQIAGVRDVTAPKLDNGKAKMDIVFVGTSDTFADLIGAKRFQGKNINVTGLDGNKVELTLAK